MDPYKYSAWVQQRGKSKIQAKKEYVVLASKFSLRIRETLNSVLKGEMETLEYKSKTPNIATSSGGALAKSVPKPKNTHEQEDKQFNQKLSSREKVI